MKFNIQPSVEIKMRHSQRGAGSLLVVVVLYAAMAITAFFVNRNLIFEQKTSANQYRATIALEAAEAGLEWATAMLNESGRMTAACIASTVNSDLRFRDRYISYDATTKKWTPAVNGAVTAACTTSQGAAGWNCSCPASGTAPSPTTPSAGGVTPGFSIAFVTNATNNSVDVVSYGCTSSITSTSCIGDGRATVRVTLAQIPGLGTPPGAPLTARGQVNIGNAALGVRNGDPTTAGVTINAGMGINASNARITTTPGTPPTSTLVGNDASLRNSSEDQMFQTFFGVPKATYKESVADAKLVCPCTESTLETAYNSGSRKIWMTGNLVMNSNVEIGSQADPFILIVDGNVEMRGTIRMFGVVYATGITWDNTGGGNALIQGAAISEGNYTGNGTPDYYYDPLVMSSLTEIPGAFGRVLGSWRDF